MGYLACGEGVTRAWLDAQDLALEVAWERVPAKAQLAPWYDPRNERIRS
jgi:4-methylaminobutanoate oxidase (formaldehyde-forming)